MLAKLNRSSAVNFRIAVIAQQRCEIRATSRRESRGGGGPSLDQILQIDTRGSLILDFRSELEPLSIGLGAI